MSSISLSYLLPYLRLTLGDTTEASYRYTDVWLQVALDYSVTALSPWWNNRYLTDATSKEVSRNPYNTFSLASPPILEAGDERPIVLMAAIITLEGSLENSAWNIGSWKDAEISFSNIESGRIRNDRLKRLWEELLATLTPPGKRLARALKSSLPGYKGNTYERDTEL